MRRVVCAAVFCGALVVLAAGAFLAGLVTERELGAFLLFGLLWYPIDRFVDFLFTWDPRAPGGKDIT